MPLSNRGAIADFFGLADEEKYEYQDYPGAAKKAVQPTEKNTTQNQPIYSISAASTREKRKTAISRPIMHESIQPVEEKKVIELYQSPIRTVAKERTTSRTSIQPKASLTGKITVMEPRTYSEAMAIVKQVTAGETALVDFHLVEKKQTGRAVDFLTGVVYALDGDIKCVGDEIFLCIPTGMEIDNSTAQPFADTNLFDL